MESCAAGGLFFSRQLQVCVGTQFDVVFCIWTFFGLKTFKLFFFSSERVPQFLKFGGDFPGFDLWNGVFSLSAFKMRGKTFSKPKNSLNALN